MENIGLDFHNANIQNIPSAMHQTPLVSHNHVPHAAMLPDFSHATTHNETELQNQLQSRVIHPQLPGLDFFGFRARMPPPPPPNQILDMNYAAHSEAFTPVSRLDNQQFTAQSSFIYHSQQHSHVPIVHHNTTMMQRPFSVDATLKSPCSASNSVKNQPISSPSTPPNGESEPKMLLLRDKSGKNVVVNANIVQSYNYDGTPSKQPAQIEQLDFSSGTFTTVDADLLTNPVMIKDLIVDQNETSETEQMGEIAVVEIEDETRSSEDISRKENQVADQRTEPEAEKDATDGKEGEDERTNCDGVCDDDVDEADDASGSDNESIPESGDEVDEAKKKVAEIMQKTPIMKMSSERMEAIAKVTDDQLMVRENGEKRWQCSMCSKNYTTRHNLITHVLGHSGVKPHKCPLCKKSFKQYSHAQTHLLTHSKVKPHKVNPSNFLYPINECSLFNNLF